MTTISMPLVQVGEEGGIPKAQDAIYISVSFSM